MSWTLTKSGSTLFLRAGAGAPVGTFSGSSVLTQWSDEVEAEIAAMTRRDWVTDYSGLSTNLKQALSSLARDMLALRIADSNKRNFMSMIDAQTTLDVLNNNITKLIIELSKDNVQRLF